MSEAVNTHENPHAPHPIEPLCCSFHYPTTPTTDALLSRLSQARGFLPVCPDCGNRRIEMVGMVTMIVTIFDGKVDKATVVNADESTNFELIRCTKCGWETTPAFRLVYQEGGATDMNNTPFMRIWDRQTRTWTFEYATEEERGL